jgi:signal peptidase I
MVALSGFNPVTFYDFVVNLKMDFSLILFQALMVTGAIVLGNRLIVGRPPEHGHVASGLLGRIAMVVVDYSRAFFPVILVVFVLRSFIVEPFRIPSGSMLPSLFVGDFILVNKFKYGIRLPIGNFKLVDMSRPERGDVMVFRYPHDPTQNYIKRVIGLPGDMVDYRAKRLRINGKVAEFNEVEQHERESKGRTLRFAEYSETIDQSAHRVVIDRARNQREREQKWTVPAGQYLVMGDNRDHSNDSRYWGFVPESHIVGHAFFVWFSWDSGSRFKINWSRIGHVIQ